MSVKTDDIRAWQQWHHTQADEDLKAVLDQLQPVITTATRRWQGTLAAPLLDTQAKILTVKALKNYKPDKGAALNTHVTNQLQKLSRLVYTHSQSARLPEHRAVGMATFSAAKDQLQGDLGRDPTSEELADHLGWGTPRIQQFQQAHERKELLGSGEFNPAKFPIADEEDPIVGYVYHDMAPTTKKLFEHITGYGGQPVLSNTQLMDKFKLSQGQLSYQKRKMTDLFNVAMKQGQ